MIFLDLILDLVHVLKITKVANDLAIFGTWIDKYLSFYDNNILWVCSDANAAVQQAKHCLEPPDPARSCRRHSMPIKTRLSFS